MCHTHSNDVVRQVETPSKGTIFIARRNFHVALEVHSIMTGKQVDDAIHAFLVSLTVKFATCYTIFAHYSSIEKFDNDCDVIFIFKRLDHVFLSSNWFGI